MKVVKTLVKIGVVLVAVLAAAKVAKKFLGKKKCGCGCEEYDFDDLDLAYETDAVSIEDEAVVEDKEEDNVTEGKVAEA